ncbi:CoA transferase [Ferroplasma sp.]|uniref:CoA transferase n=1 Tax=Ferroplasma sp. TaxID=2591003 RepID=UPI00307F2169
METVIDATRLLPGAIATRILCDAGYNIIKLEDTEKGDYMDELSTGASNFLNHGKKSISINMKMEEGRNIFYKIIKNASVFIENFKAGITERLGINYEKLIVINPELVYCSIKGYRSDPELPGHDNNFTALSGIDHVLPVQIADTGSGMYAAFEIVDHLKNKDYSKITVYMSDIPLLFNSFSLFAENNTLNGEFPNYRIYNTENGKIALGCVEQKFWDNFLMAIKRPDLSTGRLDPKINSTIENMLLCYKSEQIIEMGRKYCFPVSRIRNRNEIIHELNFGESPKHGENTFEILKNNGYSKIEIENFKKNKAIK